MDDEKRLIIYNPPDGWSKVALMARDRMVWLNQQSIAELFGTSVPNISMHISNIFKDSELDKDSVVKDYLTTAADGKTYHMLFYSLPLILGPNMGLYEKLNPIAWISSGATRNQHCKCYYFSLKTHNFTSKRMRRYVNACGGDTRKAMTLYRYNLRLSQEVFTVISCYETLWMSLNHRWKMLHLQMSWCKPWRK